jgi:hypothetical protein
MKKLIKGLREFQASYFSTHQELFEQLSHGQKPRVLFITCSDSRIDPNLITQAQLGELFVIRNAGNIIPHGGRIYIGGGGGGIIWVVRDWMVVEVFGGGRGGDRMGGELGLGGVGWVYEEWCFGKRGDG